MAAAGAGERSAQVLILYADVNRPVGAAVSNSAREQEFVSFADMAWQAMETRPDYRNLTAKQYRKLIAIALSAAVVERQDEDVRDVAAEYLRDPEGASFSVRSSNL